MSRPTHTALTSSAQLRNAERLTVASARADSVAWLLEIVAVSGGLLGGAAASAEWVELHHGESTSATAAVLATVVTVLLVLVPAAFAVRQRREHRRALARGVQSKAEFEASVRAALLADLATTYGAVLDPTYLPRKPGEQRRTTAFIRGQSVPVLLSFPDADSPLLLERTDAIAV